MFVLGGPLIAIGACALVVAPYLTILYLLATIMLPASTFPLLHSNKLKVLIMLIAAGGSHLYASAFSDMADRCNALHHTHEQLKRQHKLF